MAASCLSVPSGSPWPPDQSSNPPTWPVKTMGTRNPRAYVLGPLCLVQPPGHSALGLLTRASIEPAGHLPPGPGAHQAICQAQPAPSQKGVCPGSSHCRQLPDALAPHGQLRGRKAPPRGHGTAPVHTAPEHISGPCTLVCGCPRASLVAEPSNRVPTSTGRGQQESPESRKHAPRKDKCATCPGTAQQPLRGAFPGRTGRRGKAELWVQGIQARSSPGSNDKQDTRPPVQLVHTPEGGWHFTCVAPHESSEHP